MRALLRSGGPDRPNLALKGAGDVPLTYLWSATPLSRACSSRSTCPRCSRRPWSAWVPPSASGCCFPAAAFRRSAASPTSSASRARRCASPSRRWCRAATWSRARGRRGGTFVAERPPLAERGRRAPGRRGLGGARPPGGDRGRRRHPGRRTGRRGAARPPRRPRRQDVRRRELRGLPPRRHPVPHRSGGGRPLAAPRARDDGGAGTGERPDRADRAPGPGPDRTRTSSTGGSSRCFGAATAAAPGT